MKHAQTTGLTLVRKMKLFPNASPVHTIPFEDHVIDDAFSAPSQPYVTHPGEKSQ